MKQEISFSFAKDLVETKITGIRLSEKYKNQIRNNMKLFFQWCSENNLFDLAKITPKELISYYSNLGNSISKKTGKKIVSETVNSRFYAVKLLYQQLYLHSYMKTNPSSQLKLNSSNNTIWKRQAMSKEEINTFMDSLSPASKYGLRDRTMFELMYSSGLRVCEVSNLLIEDIDFDKRLIFIKGKFGTERVVPISIVARDFLNVFLQSRIDNLTEPVFIGARGGKGSNFPLRPESISERFRLLRRRFNMDSLEISAHSIRHSTATHLLDNGASIRHVQELLGHKNINTTERYTHLQTERIAREFHKYHPREHDLFEVVDESYLRHLEKIFI